MGLIFLLFMIKECTLWNTDKTRVKKRRGGGGGMKWVLNNIYLPVKKSTYTYVPSTYTYLIHVAYYMYLVST